MLKVIILNFILSNVYKVLKGLGSKALRDYKIDDATIFLALNLYKSAKTWDILQKTKFIMRIF